MANPKVNFLYFGLRDYVIFYLEETGGERDDWIKFCFAFGLLFVIADNVMTSIILCINIDRGNKI